MPVSCDECGVKVFYFTPQETNVGFASLETLARISPVAATTFWYAVREFCNAIPGRFGLIERLLSVFVTRFNYFERLPLTPWHCPRNAANLHSGPLVMHENARKTNSLTLPSVCLIRGLICCGRGSSKRFI